MKLSRNQLLLAAGLALTATTALADPLMPGFYIGANTGASFVTNQSSGSVRVFNEEEFDRIRARYDEEHSIRGYNGGIFAGWNFYCDERWFHGVELSWDFYSNRGHSAHDLQYANVTTYDYAQVMHELSDDVDVRSANFQDQFDMEYSLNLLFKPGAKINDSTVFYGIVGASWASFENTTSRITRSRRRNGDNFVPSFNHNDNERDRNREHCQDDDLWGFVLGAGLQTQVTHYLSVFGSYQYTYYGKCDLDGFEARIRGGRGPGSMVVEHNNGRDDPAFADVKNRQVTVDTNIFKIGIIFNF